MDEEERKEDRVTSDSSAEDTSTRWEATRLRWLTAPSAAPHRPVKGAEWQERVQRLEKMLEARRAARQRASAKQEDSSAADGLARVLVGTSKNDAKASEEESIMAGILSAFRQGRALKEPLPLSVLTKMLYESWLVDGTIPDEYKTSIPGNTIDPSLDNRHNGQDAPPSAATRPPRPRAGSREQVVVVKRDKATKGQ